MRQCLDYLIAQPEERQVELVTGLSAKVHKLHSPHSVLVKFEVSRSKLDICLENFDERSDVSEEDYGEALAMCEEVGALFKLHEKQVTDLEKEIKDLKFNKSLVQRQAPHQLQ
jgi:hypothetical protein